MGADASRRISTVTTDTIGGVGSGVKLVAVNVTTGTATAVITLRHKDASGTIISVIDASAKGSYWYGGVNCPDGIHIAQTVAAADATISYA